MHLLGWIDYSEVEDGFEESIGGFGGFFVGGMRWKDYIEQYNEKGAEYAEALRAGVLERKLKYNGSEHQNSIEGVPVFSDGTIATFSFRAWGDLIAAVWSEEENIDYSYMDFYC